MEVSGLRKSNSSVEDVKRALTYLTPDIFPGSGLTTLRQISQFFPLKPAC